MPYLIALLVGALGKLLEHAVYRILLALGVGFVTYTGLQTIFNTLTGYIHSNLGGLPATTATVLQLLKADVCISMIVSATVAVYAIKATAGALTRMNVKGPSS